MRAEEARSIFWVGVRRGLGLGLVFTVVEGLKNLPIYLRLHHQQPLTLTLASLAFNLLIGVLIGFLAAPLLKLKRGGLWHSLCSIALLITLLFASRTPFDIMLRLDAMMAGALALLLVFSRWLARRVTRARIGVAFAVIVVVVSYGLPFWLAPRNPEANERRLSAPAEAPHVLLIVLDTLRADRLELMGYHRETFPWLEAFAREGAVFQRALAPAPWTVPSHASMFTGLYPSGHGAHHEHLYLDETHMTLAEILQRHGWTTVALAANPWISKSTGLTQGFASEEPVWMASTGPIFSLAYRVAWHLGLLVHDHCGRAVTEAWLRWLEAWSGERPFFAFLNYVEPHIPYHQLPDDHLTTFAPDHVSRKEIIRASKAVMSAEANGLRVSAEEARMVNDLYDSAIRYQGALVMQAIEALRTRGVLDQTIVVVVSDHGDLLGEHDMFNHNRSLSEYLLSVPLVIRYPSRVPADLRIETPVTIAALLPTVLDLVGLPPPDNIHTRSFAPLFGGDVAASRSPLFAEQYKDPGDLVTPAFKPRNPFDRLGVRYRSLEEDGWKLIVDSEGFSWLFRPEEDPPESRDLGADHPEVVERLTAKLSALVEIYGLGPLDAETTVPADEIDLDPAVRERLRALGYSS